MKRTPFTVLELLMVIAIMAMVMASAMPAFVKIAKGTGVKLASSNISGKISAARSYAVSQRRHVAIVFCRDESVASNDLPASYMHASYRACNVYYDDTTSHWTFKSWVEGENWESTPNGTCFADAGSGNIVTGSGTITQIYGCDVTDVQSSPSPIDITNAIVFKPSGALLATSCTPASLTVREGVYVNGAFVPPTASNSITLTVNPFTCRVSYN